jgi:hypothetical protein
VLGDRIRLLDSVDRGEVPGAIARQRMDADHDGSLAPGEAQAYGDELARAVAGGLSAEVDGEPRPVAWAKVDVGLGTPVVAAGALSIDMVAWLPLADPRRRTRHELLLVDRWTPPLPGETEIRVEESPGVDVTRSTVGRDGQLSQMQLSWTGETSPIAERGLFVELTVDPAVAPMQPVAEAGAGSGRRWPIWAWALAGAGALAPLAVLLGWLRRRAESDARGGYRKTKG